jgi:hypothetical protein
LKQSSILQQIATQLETPSDAEAKPAAAGMENASKHSGQQKPAGAPSATREGAVKIQEHARDMERETALIARKADHYDSAELFLEVSIVLCSISLLAETKLYWSLSFITTGIGIGVLLWGLLMPA